MLTLAMPQSLPSGERNFSADLTESVKIADERPCRTPFWMAIAWSSVSTSIRYMIGPNVSSWTMGASAGMRTSVGSK